MLRFLPAARPVAPFRRAAAPVVLLVLLAAATATQPAPDTRDPSRAIFTEIDRILEELTRISGLQLHRRVVYDLISRDHVKQFLQKRVKEVATPEELRAEELTLKKFGLAPPDFNLEKTTVELLTEQAAAFYDFHKKRLYITDWTASAAREAALVHELAHALADQNFNLDKFIKQGRKSDDGATARMAVMEGQASWLMAEYLAHRTGQSLATAPSLLDMMSRSTELSAGQYPVLESAPLYVRETLLFPYTKGMLFQHAVFEKMGRPAFTEVFRRPPVSSQQILHPEKYFAGVTPGNPDLPVPASTSGYKRLAEGSFGELDHAILLEQYAGKEQAQAIAPQWKGGRYQLLEKRSPQRVVLAYASEWEDSATARRFFGLYRRVLQRKWKKMQMHSETGGSISGTGDDGEFLVRLEGAAVTSLEGMESAQTPVR